MVTKACGEGLMPGTAPLLAELGIDPPGHALEGVVYHQGSTRVEHLSPVNQDAAFEEPSFGMRLFKGQRTLES